MLKIVEKHGKRFLHFQLLVKLPNLKQHDLQKSSLPKLPYSFNILNNINLFLIVLVFAFLLAFYFIAIEVIGDQGKKYELNGKTDVAEKEVRLKIDAKHMVVELRAGSTTKNYKVSLVPHTQIVEENEGDYFYISLTNPITNSPFFFKEGKYTLEELDPDFLDALTIFQKTVLDKIKILDAKIYIQGKADSLSPSFRSDFRSFSCNNEPSSEISYHKKAEFGEYKYTKDLYTKIIGTTYGNDDLPELRAKFLQCKYKTISRDSSAEETPAEIIQGGVDRSINEISRNGTFLLYIPKFTN